jgi:hypothetical protein
MVQNRDLYSVYLQSHGQVSFQTFVLLNLTAALFCKPRRRSYDLHVGKTGFILQTVAKDKTANAQLHLLGVRHRFIDSLLQ